MLAATVEAAADLDVQILDGLVQLRHLFSASSLRNSAARPRDDEIPSLQVSVPGQVTMSTIVPAPGSAKLAPLPAPGKCSGRSLLLTQRITKFCSTVVRTVSFVNRRTMSASERS